MAPTDKFNFYLKMYKALNPNVGVGMDALDGFLNFIKKKYPSFYNQAQAQVREMMKAAQPQSSGNGQKPPTNPPTKNSGATPEPSDKNPKQTSGKPGAYRATDSKQVGQAISNKQIDKLYNPTSKKGLSERFSKITNGAGKVREIGANTAGQVSTTRTPNVGGFIRGAGNKLYQSAIPLTYGAGMIQNWNAPGSDWRTRTLDVLGFGEAANDSVLASLIPNPAAGFGIGTLGAGRAAANKAGIQGIRDMNIMLDTNSVKDLSPEEQQAYERYLATGQGGQLPTTNKTPDFTKGVEGSTLPADYESPEEFIKKNNITLDSNPPIVNLPALPGTNANPQQEPPKQLITGDGSVVAARANGGGNYAPTNGDESMNFDNNDNSNNFINNVINRANNMTVEEARAGLAQPTTGAASNIDASTDNIINQLMNPEGQITPREMKDLISSQYQSIRDVNRQNPLYGGDYVQPGGYNVDPDAVRRLAYADYLSGGAQNNAQRYLDMQRMNYNVQMANRAGVPYEDYVKGMTDRNANDILINAKEVEQQLTNYANQTNDMKARLSAMQAIQVNRQNAQAKLDEIYANAQRDIAIHKMDNETKLREQLLQNQGNLNVANAQGINQLTNTRYQLSHPANMMKATGSLAGSLALLFYQNPQAAGNFLSALAPQYHRALFGKVMNPNDMNDIFTAQQMVKNNPSAFENFLNKYNIFNQGQ